MADITWIVLTEPIKALINANTLEVYVAVDKSIQEFFEEYNSIERLGTEYFSIKEAIQHSTAHYHECLEEECRQRYIALVATLEVIEEKVIKAVSM